MSNITEHARRELSMIDEEPDVIEAYVKTLDTFFDFFGSGEAAMFAIPVLDKLLRLENLKPLTNDPNEWILTEAQDFDGHDVWQNSRNSEAFSEDGGKTYYLLSEVKISGEDGQPRSNMHESVDVLS